MKILFYAVASNADLIIDYDAKKAVSFKPSDFNYMKVATDNKAEAIVAVGLGDLNQIELVAVNNGFALEVMRPTQPQPQSEQPDCAPSDPTAPTEEAK